MSVEIDPIININNKKITIISDPEGLQIPDIKGENEELYVCGDLIDSTIKAKAPHSFFKTKAYNLENIQKCIKRNNIFKKFMPF